MNPSQPAGNGIRRVRIIHLEDNLVDRELVAAMLESNGIDCEMVYAQDRETFQSLLEK